MTIYIRFATVPTSLVRTGQLVKQWQDIFKIQDGGPTILSLIHVSDSPAQASLMRIGRMVKKLQQFFKIQDGGSRRLEFC